MISCAGLGSKQVDLLSSCNSMSLTDRLLASYTPQDGQPLCTQLSPISYARAATVHLSDLDSNKSAQSI
jgi:hypothetical protein